MRTLILGLALLAMATLVVTGCDGAAGGDPFEIEDNCGLVGKDADTQKMSVCDVPEEGKEDSLTGAKGLSTSVDSYNTAVWEVKNQWADTDTPAAREAGIAWGANSGLTWDEKYELWVQSMQKIDGESYYQTFELTTPWGKTMKAPFLECAEVAIFLRVTFASWYNLPFFLEAADGSGNRLYFGHFGARTANGRYGNTPKFKSWYKDFTASYANGEWPTDDKLRARKIPGNASDIQRFLGDDVHAGAYFDEIFLNKRVGYFLCLTLAYFGSINLASTANTYHLKPEAIKAGDMLIERWQRTGIGHVMVIKHVEAIGGGQLEAHIASGSMPRRQPKWEDGPTSKRYFTMDECGGPGSNYDGDYYYKLGGGVRRFRSAAVVGGRWTNVVLDIHRNDWISDRDYDAIMARPEQFETLLGEVSPEQKRDVLLATIEDKRNHLREYPASCSARIGREEAFDDLYQLMEEEFGKSKAEVDSTYRTLEDYVFAELVYEQSKTCCWNSTTRNMYEIVMQYNEEHVNANGDCQAPVTFMARDAGANGDGYQLFYDYAVSIGRGDEWVAWSEDESCPQAGVATDTEEQHEWMPYCDLAGGSGGNCEDAYEGNTSRATAQLLGPGTYSDLAVCDGVEDWFEIDADDGNVTVTIRFTDADGDLDLKVVDASGSQLASATSSSDDETVTFTKSGAAYIQVYGYQGDANTYELVIDAQGGGGGDPDDPCPDVFSGNNAQADAADVGAGSLSGLSICPGVSDWFRLPASLGSSARVTITFQHSAGDLDMKAYDAGGSQLEVSQGTSDTETLDVSLGSDVYIEVYGYSNAANTFGLDVQVD